MVLSQGQFYPDRDVRQCVALFWVAVSGDEGRTELLVLEKSRKLLQGHPRPLSQVNCAGLKTVMQTTAVQLRISHRGGLKVGQGRRQRRGQEEGRRKDKGLRVFFFLLSML